jgi:hypothetical protein
MDDELLKRVFSYIIDIKKKDSSVSAVEAITNFCFSNDIEVDYIGSLIHESEWFKNFVASDCVFMENENKIEEW